MQETKETTILGHTIDEYKPNTEDTRLPNTNVYFKEDKFKAAFQSRHYSNWMNKWCHRQV